MKRLQGFIIRNWFWIVFGCVLTRKAVEYAYQARGYKAIGSEWCVLPVILITVEACRGVYRGMKEPAGKDKC